MKIEKAKLIKALKQIGIFVGKKGINQNTSLIHFKNENKKAMLFATDFVSAGRTYMETEEDDSFEFCIEYTQLLQSTKMRGKIIEAQIENDNKTIEFFDDKTKFTWSLHESEEITNIENETKIPQNATYFEIEAKTLKNAIKQSGYARNEKDTQNPYITGVNFILENNKINLSSTDRHRIACWQKTFEESETSEKQMNGLFSPKNLQSASLFDDNEKIKIYITENQIIFVSDVLEAYATKIQCQFPDVNKFFEKDLISSYEINTNDIIESLSIIDGLEAKSLRLKFTEDKVEINTKLENGSTVNDYFVCKRLTGNDEDILVDPKLFMDIFKNVSSDKMILEFRDMSKDFKIISYKSDDGAFGMLAPQRR